jgi:4-amino-4-deoxy-L-arabinose transferase-like glycosyltransferase
MDAATELNSTTPFFSQARQQWAVLLLTLCTFFVLLGNRGLNEPDEGRYAEVGREMIETGDWLVPHFWYVPHLDKPPVTYWLVAVSTTVFGQNEWAVRLPVALAALSGALAAWCFARSLAGPRVAIWTVLILQTSLLYFMLARILTTDIFLTQFNAWAIYFFWRSWLCLRGDNVIENAERTRSEPHRTETSAKTFWLWHLAGWLAVAFAFLTKGPVALAIPLVAILAPAVFRWKTLTRKRLLITGNLGGLVISLAVASPWFLAVNTRVPGALNYMVFHQAAGHVLGTTIRSRHGFAFYFFVILAFGLLPWTLLLGWLWRRSHWRGMPGPQQDGWVMLNAWALFTFTLFSLTHSKLPAYILPIFPALAVMLALRFFRETETAQPNSPPRWIWLLCAAGPLILLATFPLIITRLFHPPLPAWMHWQLPVILALGAVLLALARKWNVSNRAALTVAAAIWSMWVLVEEVPLFDQDFKANQTLKPFAAMLRKNYHAGDALLCWGQLPEGLPYYSRGVISPTNRPYFASMNLSHVPFEFPGNRERFGDLLLPDEPSLVQFLTRDRRVLIVIDEKMSERFHNSVPGVPVRTIGSSGHWELLSNR